MSAAIQGLIGALPTVASSWQALVGYVVVTIAFVIVSLKVTRNKNLLTRLKSLPQQDRARVLQMEMGAAYLEAGLSPEQWLQQQRQRYYFIGFLALCSLLLALLIAATVSPKAVNPIEIDQRMRRTSEEMAQSFLLNVYSRKYDAVYDALSTDITKNLSFAQAQADLNRVVFQLPSDALKHTVEQVVDSGPYLNVVILTEFSVETRVRDVVTFTKSDASPKLWRYDWQPVEWPLAWPSSTQIRQSPTDAMKAYSALSQEERVAPLPAAFRGNITGSTPGWTLVVDARTNQQAHETCDASAHESGSTIRVAMKNVVGGCKLMSGQRILVNALLSGISDTGIELTGVRFFPGI
jgi:hypothetical protein